MVLFADRDADIYDGCNHTFLCFSASKAKANKMKKSGEEQLIELMKHEIEKFPYERVYFTLKQFGVKYITAPTVERVRICLALDSLGLSITTYTINPFDNKHYSATLSTLHMLGDKHVLILKRAGTRGHNPSYTVWALSAVFKKYYHGEIEK